MIKGLKQHKMKNRKPLYLATLMLMAMPLAVGAKAQSVKVAAAADLRDAMTEVVKAYRSESPTAKIEVVFGSSGNAFLQIKNGAAYDVFFSADIGYPNALADEGLTLSRPQLYAIGRVVLWSATLPVNKGLDILKDTKTKRIAVANPAHAPYGQKAVQILKHYGLYEAVKDKLVVGENVSQAAQFAVTGNADVGLIAYSLALSPSMKGKGSYFLVDDKSHEPLEQAYVLLKQSANNPEAAKFVEFVASKKARQIFVEYGFVLP